MKMYLPRIINKKPRKRYINWDILAWWSAVGLFWALIILLLTR